MELTGLIQRCLAADGGLPLAAEAGFVRSRWTGERITGVQARTSDGRLVAAGALRPAPSSAPSTAPPAVPSTVPPAAPSTVPPAVPSTVPLAAPPAESVPPAQVACGLVDPGFRGAGLGARLLDVLLAEARRLGGSVTVETEAWTPAADTLFGTRGLRPSFAEDVLRINLTRGVPEHSRPAGIELEEWSEATAERFFGAYEAAFRERPGFPGWTTDEWINDLVEDDEFRPGWSLLATRVGARDAARLGASDAARIKAREAVSVGVLATADGAPVAARDVGFVTSAAATVTTSYLPGALGYDPVPADDALVSGATHPVGGGGAGWIVQVGVVPSARGNGLGGTLVSETLRRMRADGVAEAWLTVNVDNPGAAGLYRRLGFRTTGRRARYVAH